MSDPATDDPVVVSADGVTVEKSFEPEEFSVPVIAFTLRSERDEPASVRLVDDVPDDVPPEDVGFHPDHGAEHWSIEGAAIAFERSLDPGEEFVTVYGVRSEEPADVERFLTRPTVELGPADDAGAAGTEETTARTGREPDASGALDIPEVEADADADEEPDVDLDLDLSNPSTGAAADDAGLTIGEPPADDDPAPGGVPVAGSGPADDDGPDPTVDAGDSLAAELAAEIRDDAVPEEDLETLRATLGASGGGSTDARVEHLQSRVADLEAYTEALEAFLDEESGAAAVVEDLRAGLSRTNERLDALESEVAALRAAADGDAAGAGFVARLDDLEDDVETLESGLADVAALGDRLAEALGGAVGDDDEE